jgi:NADH-quinone oxidoreductase subunit B
MAVGAVEGVWLELAGRRVALHVVELGLACCGVEVREARRLAEATGALAGTTGPLTGPGSGPEPAPLTGAGTGPLTGPEPAPEPAGPPLHVLVVAGTVTARLAPAVQAAHAALPEPRAVLAFGACAATGGPYWDSYSVLPGTHRLVPVDVWVPGCPPRPGDLLAGLEEVLRARG